MRTAFYKYVGLGLIAFTLTTASAQDRNEGSREQKLQQLKKDLNLTDAQVIKIKQIEDSYKDEKIELKRKMKEVRQKELNEINADWHNKKIYEDLLIKKSQCSALGFFD